MWRHHHPKSLINNSIARFEMPNVRRGKSEQTEKPTTSAREVAKAINVRERRERRHRGDTLDLGSIDADTLKNCLKNVLNRKVGITFGVTRDGGALSVTLLDDGETTREYVRANEDINAYLTGLAEDFGDG